MRIKEIVDAELKEDRDVSLIRLYREGAWYRAYEWSAYLAHFFPNGLSDAQRLNPIHKRNKELGSTVVSVGLKMEMLGKFMPNVVPDIQDGYADVHVDLSLYDNPSDLTFANMLDAWKGDIPVRDKQEQKHGASQILSKPMTFTSIMREILRFQLETHTPDDAYRFVRELKDMVISLV